MSKFKVEAGKCYKTRDGRKVGPMRVYDPTSIECEFDIDHNDENNSQSARSELWSATGKPVTNQDLTLIEEWIDKPSPIRTVTRKEIIAGRYGIVNVSDDGMIDILSHQYTADQLREAAHVLNQIAEALEENG